MVKNPPANAGVGSLGRKDPLEKEMVTHFSILAWEILCPMDRAAWWATYSPWGCKELGTTEQTHTHIDWRIPVSLVTKAKNQTFYYTNV